MEEVWRLNLRHLLAAAEVRRLGSTTAAAAHIHLSQPAVTQALQRLEEQLGVTLFERAPDGMVPTDAMALLAPRIEAALQHIASPHVTMARLRALLAIADHGSFAAASAETGLSAPSLHRAVSDLALSLRKALVERRGQGVRLTEQGRQSARAFRLAIAELEAGLSEIAALHGAETGRISIGAMPLARARVLPRVITSFIQRFPEVEISIHEGSRAELVGPLRDGALDLIIGALREPLLEEELLQTPLFVDRPIVVGRRGHPLAGKKPKPAQLARYSWVLPTPATPLRQHWEQYFHRAGVNMPAVPIESGSSTLIRETLLKSDLLSVLSPEQVGPELEAGWLTRIADLPPRFNRRIGVTIRRGWRPTPLQRAFIEALEAVARAAAP